MMKNKSLSEKGQALVFIALAVIGLIGMTALTVDGGNAFSDRRHAQNAADTAVLAAARAKIRNETWKNAGLAIAAQNGYDNNNTTNTVEIYGCNENGSNCGNYAGNDQYIQVMITSHVNTYFANIVGVSQVTNRVSAIARAVPGTNEPLFDGNSVVGTAPHDCKAVKYQGAADTTLVYGGIFVNSDCVDAAFFNNSAAAQLHAPSLCAVGGVQYKPGALDIPSIKTGCPAKPYPDPKYVFPDANACNTTATKTNNTLSPGNYKGTFPPHGVTFLESGVYCVDGDFRVNGGDTLTGYNVTIIMKDGDVFWNGGATIKLDAPDSGPYKGLLLYVPYSNEASLTLNGNSDSTFTGTILAPSSDIKIDGSGGADGLHSQIIGYTVDLSGSSQTKIVYNDFENWSSPTAPSMELVK
jgi:hypothetical protein